VSVYFIHAPEIGRVKIGYSLDASVRMRRMQPESPCALVLLGIVEGTLWKEYTLHEMFDAEWVHNEWYQCSDRLMAWINRAISGEQPDIEVSLTQSRRRAAIAEKKRATHRLRNSTVGSASQSAAA